MVKTSWEWMLVVDGAQQCACISANQMYTSVVVNFSIMYVLPQRNLKKNHPACVLYLFHYEAVCLHEVPPSGLIRIAFSHQGSKGFLPFCFVQNHYLLYFQKNRHSVSWQSYYYKLNFVVVILIFEILKLKGKAEILVSRSPR